MPGHLADLTRSSWLSSLYDGLCPLVTTSFDTQDQSVSSPMPDNSLNFDLNPRSRTSQKKKTDGETLVNLNDTRVGYPFSRSQTRVKHDQLIALVDTTTMMVHCRGKVVLYLWEMRGRLDVYI